MKKLPIFERIDYGDPYMKDSVPAKINHREVVATWKWQEDFDQRACASFFDHYRDVIMKWMHLTLHAMRRQDYFCRDAVSGMLWGNATIPLMLI